MVLLICLSTYSLYANPTRIRVAEKRLVDVSAADPSAVTGTWSNQSTLDDFHFILSSPPNSSSMTTGSPEVGLTVSQFEGVPVVEVKSKSSHVAAYQGPDAPESIIGSQDRSVEFWVADLTATARQLRNKIFGL